MKRLALALVVMCSSAAAFAADQAAVTAARKDYHDCMDQISDKYALIDAPMNEVVELADTICAALHDSLAAAAGDVSARHAEEGAHYGALLIIADKRLAEKAKEKP